MWIFVFQIALTRVATFVASEVLFTRTCPLSKVRKYGQIVIEVIQGTSTFWAVTAVIWYEGRMREHVTQHRSLLKLVSFKGVVGMEATQDILFSVLAEKKVFFPVEPFHVSYNDFAKGVPTLLLILELTIVAIMFLWSFEFSRYRSEILNGAPIAAGPGKALLSLFGWGDIGRGVAYMFTAPSKDEVRQSNEGAYGKYGGREESGATQASMLKGSSEGAVGA